MVVWKFIETEEILLLDQANLQVQKVLTDDIKEGNEEQYTVSLICTVSDNISETQLSLVQAIFRSINIWCDSRLQDYHLHFSEVISCFLINIVFSHDVWLALSENLHLVFVVFEL